MIGSKENTASTPPTAAGPVGVRFLLTELLAELEVERALATRGLEKLDRKEIRKLVREKGDRRVRSPK